MFDQSKVSSDTFLVLPTLLNSSTIVTDSNVSLRYILWCVLSSGGNITWHYTVHLLTAAICVCCVVVALQKEAQRALKHHQTFSPGSIPPSWSFQILPTLYQHYQKVETIRKLYILFLMLVVHWCKPWLHVVVTS